MRIPLYDLVLCLSKIMDLISPELVNHHRRVSYIAYNIALEMGLSSLERTNILYAGLLHDCGAIYFKDKANLLEFELDLENSDRHQHSYLGYLLLKNYKPFADVAYIVKHHHVYWNEIDRIEDTVEIGSHILHLADRVEVLIDRQKEILAQRKDITKKIDEVTGSKFAPQIVEAFKNLAVKESFWFYFDSPLMNFDFTTETAIRSVQLDIKGIFDFAKLIYKIIDYRSIFTSTHSIGVSASAEALAKYCGFNKNECEKMRIAGLLHDIGKLAVPTEILEKPGRLDEKEINIMKRHTYYSYYILQNIGDLNTINNWASFHHERLDGSGYPFHLTSKELSLGSRIMAVADVFTAITEDRPYRKGMTNADVINILNNMVDSYYLDKSIVSILKDHIDEINTIRMAAQTETYKDYQSFRQDNYNARQNLLAFQCSNIS